MVLDLPSSKPKNGSNIWRKLWPKTEPQPLSIFSPEPWQCIAHLKLMRAFARLRSEFLESTMQGSVDEKIHAHALDSQPHQLEASLHDMAWKAYLTQAAYRFELWWETMVPKDDSGNMIQINRSTCSQPTNLQRMLEKTKPMTWTKNNLPPLDVIMILHGFMLNPRCFLEDCIRYNMLPLWKAGMPWSILDEVIGTSENTYAVTSSAKKIWEKKTKCDWEIGREQPGWKTKCPFCYKLLTCKSSTINVDELKKGAESCSQTLTVYCPTCDATFNEDELHVAKLRRALDDLQERDVPLPGTLLNFDGLVESFSKPGMEPDLFQLNTFVLSRIRMGQLFHMTSLEKFRSNTPPRLNDLQYFLDHDFNPSTQQHLRPAIRRLFLQCSDTVSPFALDLAAAVVRQGTFISKMEEIDWLHSPALLHTITDLLRRYEVFFKIMKQNKKNVAVPTFAVDLAWHTHQLMPASYYAYSLANAGNVFIDHDDRIAEDVRTDAFGWTTEQYKALTHGEEYGQCLCWVCATAYEHAHMQSSRNSVPIGEHGHVELGKGSDLEKFVLSKIAAKQCEKLEEDYRIACDTAYRCGLQEPDRKQFLEQYSWSYPKAVPVLAT